MTRTAQLISMPTWKAGRAGLTNDAIVPCWSASPHGPVRPRSTDTLRAEGPTQEAAIGGAVGRARERSLRRESGRIVGKSTMSRRSWTRPSRLTVTA
jgi:hypothetical protein